MRLDVESLTVRFGGVLALSSLTTSIASGERRAVIGPNGAGKTTLFNALSGEVKPSSGMVRFDGRKAMHLGPAHRARLGLTRTFQRSSLYPDLTVRENIALAVRRRRGQPWALLGSRREPAVARETAERIRRSGIEAIAERRTKSIGHGQQRAVEIEIALALEPRALLLDEPAAGLAPEERKAVLARIAGLTGTTIVVVEHDLDFVFNVAETVTVLDHGVIVAEGSPEEIRANAKVQEVYLGVA